MADPQRAAAEVRASQRHLNRPTGGAPAGPPGPATPPALLPVGAAPITVDVDDLLGEILAADRIDILGVLPWQCAGRLLELEDARRAAGSAVTHPTSVRYLTPARERVISYRHSGVLGTLMQRWLAGITGLRNWLLSQSGGSDSDDLLQIYEFDDIYLECLIHTRTGGVSRFTLLTELPVVGKSPVAGSAGGATLIVVRMPEAQTVLLRSHLERVAQGSVLLSPRKIRCRPDAPADQGRRPPGDEFVPTVGYLSSYGPPAAGDVEPIAVIAVCVTTAKGPSLLLKRRSKRNSRDDFDTLSLLSERVLAEDLAGFLGTPLPRDPDKALDELWVRQGKPLPFVLPESSFRNAAQRELFVCCGLDVTSERLDFRGTCLVDREDGDTQLGFYVFRLDLGRGPTVDELKEAQGWNEDLVVVPLGELYGARNRPKLNRLLRRRESWLRQQVFTPGSGTEGART